MIPPILWLVSISSKILGTPGKPVYLTITGRNFGNGIDTIVLTVDGLPQDWKYELRDANFEIIDRITLPPGNGTGRVTLIVMVPKQMPDFGTTAIYEFSVLGYSKGAKEKNLDIRGGAKLGIEIILPDLYISKIDYTKPNAPNKMVTMHVDVTNDGAVSTENVVVYFYEGNKVIDKVVFDKLAPQSTQKAAFTWLSKGGNNKLRFVVDRDNEITETNEDNNAMTLNVLIPSKERGFIPGFEILVILIAMLFVSYIWVRWYR
ncbi:MAG: CARDB domain-containing protein [Candidatus Thermoplasmatota archaeon]